MKWSFVSVGVLIFCIIGIMVVTFFNEVTVSNEQDYYTLKEAAEASMYDAIDVAYYRLTGKIKISQEKFVENLTRRFTETSTFGQGNYDLIFYDISESPPKISVRVVDSTNSYNLFNTFSVDIGQTKLNIVNEISGILEIYSEGEEKDDIVVTPTSFVSRKDEEIEFVVIDKEEDKEEIVKQIEEKKKDTDDFINVDAFFQAIIDFIDDIFNKYDFFVIYDGNIYVPKNSDVVKDDYDKCELKNSNILDCDNNPFIPYDIPEIPVDDVIVSPEIILEVLNDETQKELVEPSEGELIKLPESNYISSYVKQYGLIFHITNNFKYEQKDTDSFFKDVHRIVPKYKEYVVLHNNELEKDTYYVSADGRQIDLSNYNSCTLGDGEMNCGDLKLIQIEPTTVCCVSAYDDDDPFTVKVDGQKKYYFRMQAGNYFSCVPGGVIYGWTNYVMADKYDVYGAFNGLFVDDNLLYESYSRSYYGGVKFIHVPVAFYDANCN